MAVAEIEGLPGNAGIAAAPLVSLVTDTYVRPWRESLGVPDKRHLQPDCGGHDFGNDHPSLYSAKICLQSNYFAIGIGFAGRGYRIEVRSKIAGAEENYLCRF